jgi:apolipoprotein N-acyltransferase
LLLGIAFLPRVPGFVAWGALVPLLVAIERRARARAGAGELFGLGWFFGFVFFALGLHWIALLSDVAITVPWLKYLAWLAAAAYLGLFPGLTVLLVGWLARPRGRAGSDAGGVAIAAAPPRVPVELAFPVVFVVVEWLRGSGELGFPWFAPAYTQQAYVPLLQMASLGGAGLVTLWVVMMNVLLWRSASGGARGRWALAALLLVLLPWFWGQRVVAATQASGAGSDLSVALVQGNIPGEVKWSGRHQPEILRTFLDLTGEAGGRAPRPLLVLWPETATGSYLHRQLDQSLAVRALAVREDLAVFSGFAEYDWDTSGAQRFTNAAGRFGEDGSFGPVYAKRHLVPFGERMPFERFLPWLGRIELGQAEWTPGSETVLFPSAAGSFSCLICFEAVFADLARDDVRRGARWLVNITNDEWFGRSAALPQHAAMAVFRAVENRVPLARCANTGLTLLVDANGRIVARLPVFEPGVLVARLPPVPRRGVPTPYTRFGDWPAAACGAALLALVFVAWRRSR